MDNNFDDEDPLIEQNDEDFGEEDAFNDGQGTRFRCPTDPLKLVFGEKDRSTTLSLDKKKKELLNIKAKLATAIGECGKCALLSSSSF